MPKIIIKCVECKKELDVKDSFVDTMGDIVIQVTTCLDCLPSVYGDCSDCEDAKLLRKMKEDMERKQGIT